MLHAVFGKNGNRIWFGSQAWLLGEMYQADLVSWATVKGAILGVASCSSTMSKAPHKRLALQLSKLGMCWTTQKASSAKHKLGSRLGDSSSSHAWLFHASPRTVNDSSHVSVTTGNALSTEMGTPKIWNPILTTCIEVFTESRLARHLSPWFLVPPLTCWNGVPNLDAQWFSGSKIGRWLSNLPSYH